MTETPNQTPQTGKQTKKTEVIEVRLPFEKKHTFMEACKASEQTASSVLRSAIDQYLSTGNFGAKPSKYRSFTMIVSGMILGGLIVGGVMTAHVPTTAPENPVMVAHFKRIDTSTDGLITLAEFLKGTAKPVTEHAVILRLDKPLLLNTDDDIDTNDFVVGPTKTGEVKYVTFSISSDLMAAIEGDHPNTDGASCSQALADIKDAEIAREFYTLDQDNNNLLTQDEFARNQLLPSIKELKSKFTALDTDTNGQLSQPEINADFSLEEPEILKEHAETAPRKLQAWPAICQDPIGSHTLQPTDGPQIPVAAMLTDLSKWSLAHTPPVDGMNPALFRRLDANNSRSLSFDEFVSWYF